MQKNKIIIAGVAIVAALGIFIVIGTGKESIPDTDDTRTEWICLTCKKPFSLTAAEYEKASQSSGKSFLVRCPPCSELKAVRAAQCGSCQDLFALTNAEGQDTPCPKCHPATVNAQAKPEEEVPEAEAPPTEEEAPADRPIMFVQ